MNHRLIKGLLVALSLLLLVAPACGGGDGGGGSSSSLVGSWNAISDNGQPLPPHLSVILVFKADGTGTETAEGQTINFVWSLSGSTLTMTAGKDTEVTTLTWLPNNQIQIVDQGDVLVFQRL